MKHQSVPEQRARTNLERRAYEMLNAWGVYRYDEGSEGLILQIAALMERLEEAEAEVAELKTPCSCRRCCR